MSTFKVKDREDLVISPVFLQHLNDLPLEYSYGMYRDLIMRFGTHYIASGKLGGQYDLLYQYNREALNSSGTQAQRRRSEMHSGLRQFLEDANPRPRFKRVFKIRRSDESRKLQRS